jgi:hypothetical protein
VVTLPRHLVLDSGPTNIVEKQGREATRKLARVVEGRNIIYIGNEIYRYDVILTKTNTKFLDGRQRDHYSDEALDAQPSPAAPPVRY